MRYITLIILAICLASCANPKKVTFSGPVEVEVETASKADVGCRVQNCSAYRIRLLSARVRLHYETENFATVLLAAPVEIAKCSEGYVRFPLRFRFANPLMALSAENIETLDWENMYVTGEAEVRAGLLKKKIRLKNYPVREFLTNFDTDL